MFNNAGVEIYAFKPDYLLGKKNTLMPLPKLKGGIFEKYFR